MNASDLIEEYRNRYGSNGKTRSIAPEQWDHLAKWIENQTGVPIEKPLIVTNGSGGGQKYRLYYYLYDIKGNAGRPAIFYTDMKSVEKQLEAEGFMPLQKYLDKYIEQKRN